MPHATAKYGFEDKVFQWAVSFSSTMTGQMHIPFLLILDSAGAVRRTFFGDNPGSFNRPMKYSLTQTNGNWLFWDPFEPYEYGGLEWTNVQRTTLERLMGQQFEEDDFTG